MDASGDQIDKSAEHVIPQMVVTSADDEAEAIQISTEAYPVPDVSCQVSSTVGVSQEAKDVVHPTETVHQQLTNIGTPKETSVEDVSSRGEFKSEEPVIHTAVQRPLIIESEKCASPSPSVESNFQSSESSTPLPQALPPTTMQRPLVFEGSSPQTENFVLPPEYPLPSQELPPLNQEALPEHMVMEDEINLNVGVPSTSTDSKPKSSSFSWMPNFPKLHAHGKEPKDSNLMKKDETQVDIQNIQDAESPGKKDGLQNVKKFFDNLLHDTPSDSNDKSKVQNEVPEELDANAKKVPKDEKQSYYKKIFGSSKSESESETKVPSQNEFHPETETASKEPHKDSKYNIKKMFDSFKHDDKKDISKKSSDSTQVDIKSDVTNVTITTQLIPNEADSVPKEQSKDSKYNIKKMFDSFKHDVVDKKDSSKKGSEIIQSDIKSDPPKVTVTSQIQSETENMPKEQPKDSKYNIKKMLDSFKHDGDKKNASQKDTEVLHDKTKSKVHKGLTSQSDIQNEAEAVPKDSAKESKYNIKKMFDSLKHDVDKKDTPTQKGTEIAHDKKKSEVPKVMVTSQTDIQNEVEPLSKDQSKDSKYNLKKMFDSFKHDFVEKKDTPKKESDILQSEIKPDSVKPEKDSKSGIKKFFGSLIHEGGNIDEATSIKASSSPEDNKDLNIQHTNMKSSKNDDRFCKDVLEFELPELTISSFPSENPINQSKVPSTASKLKDSEKTKPKEGQHGVKKFFSSFKQEGPGTSKGESGKFHVTFMERENSLKRSHSFKDSILLKDTPDESEKKSKDGLQGVKKYFSSSKRNHSQENIKDIEKRKSNEIKRSQSCRETAAEKEGFHIKSFFDSFSHKSFSKTSSQSSTSRASHSEEHIYDTVGKPDPKKFPPSTVEDLKQTPKKTAVKSKEDQSGMKKLFDSFIHKDQSSKPKAKSGESGIEKEQDKVPYLTSMSNVTGTERTLSKENIEPKNKTKKLDPSHIKNSDQSNVKNIPTIIMTSTEAQSKPKIATKPPSIQVSSPSTTDGKTSVFNTISDNIMAIKDKVLHPKESKKTDIGLNDEKFAEYDLQQAANQNEFQPSTSGTYKPIKDDSFIDKSVSHEPDDKKSGLVSSQNKFTTNATVPQETKQTVTSDSKKTLKLSVKRPTVSPGTPETLYDTCCLRLAVLLGKKAMEIVSDQTKSPPKKPPKPSAEAIAKARAAVVSRRLREIQYKGQSIGENIPVGYDGIRFADDETESSCDYKDVDNFDYIMDYELINRYKCDSKLDTFSDPSTCSGISSYYTADTVTLKDETFSDAPLETVSLNSNDSHLFQNLSSAQNANEIQTWPSSKKTKNGKEKSNLSFKDQRSVSGTGSELTSSNKSSSKRIPPPIPPKPILSPKDSSPNKTSSPVTDTKGSMSQCINGLSLSPRLQSKFSNDTVITRQRPLMVAGFKGTDFSSLQAKSKESQGKQLKDRKFNTVLKNESLKTVSTISSLEHKPLQNSKSSPSQIINPQSSTPKKFTPQRPPLPNLNQSDKLKTKTAAPPVPEKPKRESRMAASHVPEEKRTISPPRPPPPVLSKISSPPPRPPPPTPKVKPPFYENSENQPESKDNFKPHEITMEHVTTFITEQEDSTPTTTHEQSQSANLDAKSKENYHPEITCPMEGSAVTEDKGTIDGIDHQSQQNIEMPLSPENEISLSLDEKIHLSNLPELNFVWGDEIIPQSTPKPPPRSRRLRSRTVEIAPKEKTPETNLRRSQSLSDIDIQQRTSHLNVSGPTEKSDLKNLYTSVNKDGKRTVIDDSHSLSLERVSSRPLPAPPPPPRKFRSLDRKPKEKHKRTETNALKENQIDQFAVEAGSSYSSLKPPERKRKSDKHRFLSLSPERKKFGSRISSDVESPQMPRSSSAPIRPERRHRHEDTEYDENANVAFSTVAEVHHHVVALDECGNEILESSSKPNIPIEDTTDSKRERSHSDRISPHPRLRKAKNPKIKSHSSWYDETLPSEDSWEIVDYDPSFENAKDSKSKPCSGVVPTRRQSDPSGSRIRQNSRFYVNVEPEVVGLPHSDKETSPLHIDCSEKSVQTSLETLSQGFVSHDDVKSESSDNTDNLLNMVKTLQSELKATINRHKSLDDEDNDSSNIGTDSEKLDPSPKAFLKTPSVQSSTSDLWPLSSSDESDGEVSHDGSVNLSDIALTRKKKKIFYIAQEIMTSEEVFVDTLKLLNVDFKAAVEAANKQKGTPVIPDEVLGQMLNHLPQLQHLNENLLMELKDRIDNWDKTEKIADVIVKMGPFLKLYSWFIHDFESNLSLMEESKRKFPLFAQVVKEFEASARCKRLSLNHYMLKPIQRIPQYRLLLQEYLHHLSEDCLDYQDTVTALQIVSEVANHANESMKQGDNAQKLISIQNSIIGHNEIIKPGRLFLKEGVLMKLSRKGMQPRWFVLFNDLLLYLTPVQQGLYRINHKLYLTGMKVAIPIQQDYQNEFSIISETRSFSLAARSQEERQEWIVALTKAIEENMARRRTFTPSVMDRNSEEDSEFVLGKRAPVWIPDARVTMCQLCTSEFTVTFRRHHCRACGKVICSICSGNRIPLHYLKGHKAKRVCDECYTKLGPDAGGSPENAETDSDNQQIAVKPHLRTDNRYVKKVKRNLPSVLKEVCANDQGSTISGYLQKKTGKSWKKEWFVVKDKVLYEYKASEDVAALKSTPLLGYQIESFSEAYENVDPSLLFQLTHPGQAPIVFHADSVGSTERWIAALKEASVLE